MTITQISYSKTAESLVMGASVWIKIGISANVQEDEDVSVAIEQAKGVVEDAIQKAIPPPVSGDLFFNVSKNKME